jgi:hypothetical protein
MRPNETELSDRWRGASFPAKFNVGVIKKLDVATASGWVERSVKRCCGFTQSS